MACCDFRKTPRTLGSISNPFRMHTNSQTHSQLMAITIKVLKEEKKLIISYQTVFGLCIFSTILKTTTTHKLHYFSTLPFCPKLWQSSRNVKMQCKLPYSIQSARCFLEFTPIFFFLITFLPTKETTNP